MRSELGTEKEFSAIAEADEPAVERFIKMRSQAESVARVKSLFGEVAPRKDVTGDKELGDGIPGNAAAPLVRRQHDLPEEALSCPDAHGGSHFARSRGKQ